jgi:peptide/nickel transport system substrate-binding protein
MRSTVRVRAVRALAALALAAALIIPAAVPAAAQDGGGGVLRVGTTQDLDSMNPFQTALITGFEVFTLNYDLLVNFGPDLEPAPGFAESWEQSEDGLTWTFTMRDGMLWSDGEPATSEDARWTFQFVLDAINSDEGYVGLGYLDPYIKNAGVETIEAPDPTTLVITTDRPNDQILKTYVPILPKHIWEDQTLESIPDFTNNPPVVGSGPYQAVEWQTGQFIRFERNENYWKDTGAADEVVIQIFGSNDTMVQALRTGQLDYARDVNPDQFDALQTEDGIVTVEGAANGFTEFGFNTYGTGTGNTIENGGPSTPALLDPAFRDALGYAIDKELLVDRVLGGYGEPGTTQVPPFQVNWHVPPENPRTFDIAEANRRLEAAGYVLDGSGNRLDLEGDPISLRLYHPDSDASYPNSAQFIQGWFQELGIRVTPDQFDSGALVEIMLPPEAGDEYVADFDLFIWGWGGDVDPNSLLEIFTCDQIGGSSDSMYCNPRYDELFQQQNRAESPEERAELIAEMQRIMYDEAPYHILFYDASLHAYRTDRFSGWQNQPTENGTPLFGYGSLGYTLLTVAGEEPSPEPTDGAPAPTDPGAPAESPAPGTPDPGQAADNTPLLIGIVALVAVVAVGLVLMRRRNPTVEDE